MILLSVNRGYEFKPGGLDAWNRRDEQIGATGGL